jgi:hypothetical protein
MESATELITEITNSIPMDSKVIEAVLSLANPPPALLAKIARIACADEIAPLSLISLMKQWPRVRQLRLLTVADLFSKAAVSSIVMHHNPQVLLGFFTDIPLDEVVNIPPSDLLAFFHAFCESNLKGGFDMVVAAIERSHDVFAEAVVGFLMREKAMMHLSLWCNAFPSVIGKIAEPFRGQLYERLHTMTQNEIAFGHVSTAGGTKQIQDHAVPRSQAMSLEKFDVVADPPLLMNNRIEGCTSLAYIEYQKTGAPQLVVQGWREIAALLSLAPPTDSTLQLLDQAMEVHAKALVGTLVKVLNQFDSDTMFAWIEKLLAGTQQKQTIAIELFVGVVEAHADLFPKILNIVAGLILNKDAPVLVKNRAMKAMVALKLHPMIEAHQEIVNLVNPELFRHPEVLELDPIRPKESGKKVPKGSDQSPLKPSPVSSGVLLGLRARTRALSSGTLAMKGAAGAPLHLPKVSRLPSLGNG